MFRDPSTGWVVWTSSGPAEVSCEGFGESSGLAIRRPPSAWERLRSPFMILEFTTPKGGNEVGERKDERVAIRDSERLG